MPEKRADTLLKTMRVIEHFTLQRAWHGLSDDELFWEPIAGSWGVRMRAQCRTPTPFGNGDWVVDFDTDLVMAAIQGDAVEPLTTIGWLMWSNPPADTPTAMSRVHPHMARQSSRRP